VQESPDRISPTLQRYTSHLLRRAFHRAGQLSHVGLPEGMHPRDFTVLGVLAGQDVLSQQDLADRLEINRTIVVKLIDRLSAAGYAVRTRNSADRRTYMLSVTDAGRRLLDEVDHTAVTGENEFLGSLTVRERRDLNRLLRELVPEISQEVAGEQPSSYFITLAYHRLRRRGNELMAEHGLQARHSGALIALHDAGACSQQQLARIVGTTEATMVLVIDELEAAGAVIRERNPADRRSNVLILTHEGMAMHGHSVDVLNHVQAEVVQTLGEQRDKRLRTLLTKLLWG
jgi:DNA-binding MarR family transcriptional regulator